MTMVRGPLLALCLGLLMPAQAWAHTNCPRYQVGSVVTPPPDLYSQNGVLKVALGYYTELDQWNRTLFCFVTPSRQEGPTLHVNPGDQIQITLMNQLPDSPGTGVEMSPGNGGSGTTTACLGNLMTASSVNMHFHGMNIPPHCHSDDVIHTLVNPGQTFQYVLNIPKNEPPGLYWYHPHVHGISSPAVQGGATGVIEVEGIANLQPIVAGLPQRYLVIRDGALQNPAQVTALNNYIAPYWDVSLNYVPIPFQSQPPNYAPAVIQMNPGAEEFWRVANTAADTVMDLQLVYDGVVQPVTVVALDGVPVGSQDGKHQGTTYTENDVLIPPAGRAEFVMNGPSASVKNAVFMTRRIDTGPAGDNDPPRPLATIQLTQAKLNLPITPVRNGPPNPQRFDELASPKPTATRHLYFSEVQLRSEVPPTGGKAPPPWGGHNLEFFITVDGQTPEVFNPANPPSIITQEGAVEDWTIENRSGEVHEFHIHQIHYLLLAVNGVPVPKEQQQFYDTYQVPYWSGTGKYPSIKVRMDFRGTIAGDFVYHCHILDHEDLGMMAIIRVLPKSRKTMAAR
jgi:FtsP/CotA-like multicopper oxidase with cupredoxin domain